MPYRDADRRRQHDAQYKRLVARPRAKAHAAERAEQIRQHREWEAARRLENLVETVTIHDLYIDDGRTGYTFPAGSILYVLPGLVHLFERTLLATPAPQPQTTAPREPMVLYRGAIRPLCEVEAERQEEAEHVTFRRVSPPVDPAWGDDEPED